jgi:putative ABC transport system permease protein
VGKVVHLEQLAGDSVSNFRATTWLFLSFAAVALFLATIGIYGLVSYSVAQRAHEISIRMAIGATPAGVMRMILARSLRVALLGTIAGLVGAFVAIRGLSALLYGVAPTDPLIYASVSAFLLCVTALASFVPAWRTSRIDPIRKLRAE